MLRRDRLYLVLLIAILITGCQLTARLLPAPTPTPQAATLPPAVQDSSPTPRPLAATPTAGQASPTAQPTIEHISKGPFQKFTPSMGLPSGDLNDLWMDEKNTIWLAASSGIFSGTEGLWQMRLDQRAVQILGSDAHGRVWVLLDDGNRIAYNDTTGWRLFDETEGWAALPDLQYPSFGMAGPPATDKLGQVWFATGRDELRRFETKTATWKTYTAEQMGFPPPEKAGYQGHLITDVVTSSAGKVWVSDCIGEGEVLRGQGVRRLDGETWNAAPPTANECVLDMAVDSLDRIWVGAFDKVMRYDPLTGNWDQFKLPSGRSALVTRIAIDHEDNPWIEVARAGGASLFGAVERYHLQSNKWVLDEEPGVYIAGNLAFDFEGRAWICSGGRVSMTPADGTALPFGTLDAADCRIAFDDSGQGWLLARGGQDAGLWYFNP